MAASAGRVVSFVEGCEAMKVGVLSDTHIPGRARALPPHIFELFAGVDLILHAGDLVAEYVLSELETIAPVEAVAGNMDSFELRRKLERKKVLTLEGAKIGLTHGDGFYSRAQRQVIEAFKHDAVDCIVCGHTHRPLNMVCEGVFLFNPGSATDPRWVRKPSCGILYINKDKAHEKIRGEIIHL